MSNNRGNNRRRGRGNRSQNSNPVNRIDSRARGNAPQLLEKYKKLAHDSALNGDRVQAEYYLQFADHYFRVLADAKAQKDEVRQRRDDERDQQGDSDDYDSDEQRQEPRGRQSRSRRDEDSEQAEDGRGVEGEEITPEDNPFIPEGRSRGRRPRTRAPRDAEPGGQGAQADDGGIDQAVLPPAIARRDEAGSAPAQDEQEKPKPRRRAPRKRSADGDAEALEAVN